MFLLHTRTIVVLSYFFFFFLEYAIYLSYKTVLCCFYLHWKMSQIFVAEKNMRVIKENKNKRKKV